MVIGVMPLDIILHTFDHAVHIVEGNLGYVNYCKNNNKSLHCLKNFQMSR